MKATLFAFDEKDRYIHIYYNDRKRTAEREQLEEKNDLMAAFLKNQEGKKQFEYPKAFSHYFDPIYHTQGDEKTFMYAREGRDVIDSEIKLCGYFIITSGKMTAEEALELYKIRDGSEKLFRGDKSYLVNRSFQVHGSESVNNKIFIEP